MPLYEYACPRCQTAFTRLRPLAAAAEPAPCPACGAPATRTIAPFAVLTRAPAAGPPSPARGRGARGEGQPEDRRTVPGPPLCQRYPHIPLLCHMEPKAAERWIAKAEGREEQYLEQEARRQEEAARRGLPPEQPHTPPGHGHLHVIPEAREAAP
jgi:putative FmdB family regulatory protein